MRKKLTYEETHRVNEEGILEKWCNRCEKWFPCTEEYFYKTNVKSQDGLFPYCKKCNIKASSKRQEDNKEFIKEYMHIYYINNIDTMIENAKRANRTKPEQYKTKQKEYRQNNKDRFKNYNDKYANKKHSITIKEWYACLKYFNYQCAYCGISQEEAKEKYGQYLHKEHVDHEGSNKIDNCVPACKGCNSEKRQQIFTNWYNENNSKFDCDRFEKILDWVELQRKFMFVQ